MVYVFDENFSYRVVDALRALEEGNRFREGEIAECFHIVELGKKHGVKPLEGSYTDEQVIEIAGLVKGVVFTHDKDFKSIKHKYSLYKKHKVGVVYFKTYIENRGYWNMITFIISKWPDLKEAIENDSAPFCYFLDKKGLHKQPF